MDSKAGLLRGSLPKESAQLPLTYQNLGEFKKETESSSVEKTTTSTESTASSADPMLPSYLRRKGVYCEKIDLRHPKNLNKLLGALNKKRIEKDSQQFEDFDRRVFLSYNEEGFKVHFISIILNPPSRKVSNNYSMHMDIEWALIRPNFDIDKELTNLKPDYFEAFHIDLYPIKVQEDLGHFVKPSIHPFAIPSLCIEFKGPRKGKNQVAAQVAHDGAVMLDAAWEIHQFMDKPARDFLGHTKALAIAVTDNKVDLYTCHAEAAGEKYNKYPKSLRYHTHKLVGTELDTEAEFMRACRLVHNAQDWCRNQAEMMRNDLLDYYAMLDKK